MQLEELENIITNFDNIENLSTEKYLTKYVTPTLSELFTQIAKVKPENPVEFLVNIQYSHVCSNIKTLDAQKYDTSNIMTYNEFCCNLK